MSNNILSEETYYSCTGCSACGLICPNGAISLTINNEGFYVPIINTKSCVNCGLCKEVCYKFLEVTSIPEKQFKENHVFAVINNYVEQMREVSTAGIATVIAKKYFTEDKNVVGVSFSPMESKCFHKLAVNLDDINSFRGSKYIQSQCFGAFKELLDSQVEGVVFGTPCQIYGLRKVLSMKGRDKDFLLVDLFCLGVPSLNLWKAYISFLQRIFNIKDILEVSFRNKTQGWHKFSIFLKDSLGKEYRQNLYNDIFFRFYLQKRCQNRPCYDCLFRHKHILSDIRLGDFWGPKYQVFDDGVELMTINTDKGAHLWHQIKHLFRSEMCTVDDIKKSQKYDVIPIPDDYKETIDQLSRNIDLELI